MAKFDKIAVMQKIAEAPMVPVFYNKDLEVCKNVVKACYDGGVRAFEFTNRGDFAQEVFGELVKWADKECPDLAVGVRLSMLLQLACIFSLAPVSWLVLCSTPMLLLYATAAWCLTALVV